jgi:hypothetical protein
MLYKMTLMMAGTQELVVVVVVVAMTDRSNNTAALAAAPMASPTASRPGQRGRNYCRRAPSGKQGAC